MLGGSISSRKVSSCSYCVRRLLGVVGREGEAASRRIQKFGIKGPSAVPIQYRQTTCIDLLAASSLKAADAEVTHSTHHLTQ